MAIDRPTFSESWYRVAQLRPKLRPVVQTYRQQYRGRSCHVVHDPSNNQFFQLEDPAYRLVGLLDGRRTIAQAWEVANAQLGDMGPTQNEVIQVLGQLYTNNLLEGDMPADAAGLFNRQKQRQRREIGSYFMNLLSLRIPILDPDHFLDRWVWLFGKMFTIPAFIGWCVLMVVAGSYLIPNADQLIHNTDSILGVDNLFLLYIAFWIIKITHEFGHSFSCKQFGVTNNSGGEVHVLGLMFLVLIPLPYMDASSSWAFRSRWQRAIVGAAGMYVELAIAAVCAIIWSNTAQGTGLHAICYNIMFVSGFSTLLFNANPLLRYDGYYILSDLLEIPNLAQRSQQYLQYMFKRYVFGARRAYNPANSLGERPLLLLYAIFSSIYRVFVSVAIFFFVIDKLFIVGIIMAFAGLFSMGLMSIGKFIQYLFTSNELARVRPRAQLITAITVTIALLVLGLYPMPDRSRGEGIIEPTKFISLHMPTGGFIDSAMKSGSIAKPDGEPLITASNPTLEFQREKFQAVRDETKARYELAKMSEQAAAQAYLKDLASADQNLAYANYLLTLLKIKPAFEGIWVAPSIEHTFGSFHKKGDLIGILADMNRLQVRVITDQTLGPLIASEVGEKGMVEMRAKSRSDVHWSGIITKILPAGSRKLASTALNLESGGATAVDPEDAKGVTALEPFFEVWVEPVAALHNSPRLLAGQRVVVRFELAPKPLLVQWWRILRQTIQRRFQM